MLEGLFRQKETRQTERQERVGIVVSLDEAQVVYINLPRACGGAALSEHSKHDSCTVVENQCLTAVCLTVIHPGASLKAGICVVIKRVYIV